MKLLKPYLNFKFVAIFVAYVVLAFLSLSIAYLLRFDFQIPDNFIEGRNSAYIWFIGTQIAFLFAFGQFDAVFSQFRLPDLFRLFFSLLLSSLYVLFLWYIYNGDGVPPRSVVITNLLLYFVMISGMRIFLRIYSGENFINWLSGIKEYDYVAIIGAGEVGAVIGADLLSKQRTLGIKPIVYLDDSDAKVGRLLNGIPVVDTVDALEKVVLRYQIKKVIIAFPSAPSKRIQRVAETARSLGLDVDIVPALTDLVSGRATATQIRPIELEDLLGRDPVDLNFENIRKMLVGHRVLVTGAGGSIGKELVAQILEHDPESLLCIDKSELAIFDLNFSLLENHSLKSRVQTRILDITQSNYLRHHVSEFKPTIIFHAAAHKHVNLMEDQPEEALRNNFFASIKLMELASELSVERFIFISTDKAINPTSVMGVSKRLTEIAMQKIQAREANRTKFMAVRFGNVLGSSGSVINIFRAQIAKGGPLTVTDPEVTRYFMTVTEAIGLVLESATQGVGGEIFVLDMGEPIKIAELARQMIALSGFKENIDIDIEFTGLKAGEKLYEEVQHFNEVHALTTHPRIFKFVANNKCPITLESIEAQLLESARSHKASQIKEMIKSLVEEYTPSK
ncbi:MAG: nucleoside-diphosphate sugar epimerase/dehydratase [Opitutae bacterium]|nr:nucleoside-diphosphate sugar epimerase/dehydratase [Opitutae bacterium]